MPTPSKHPRHPALTALGAVIRKRRQELKFSQEKLAEQAGLDRSYLGQIERGDNSVALLTLVSIAGALGMSLEQLMAEARL